MMKRRSAGGKEAPKSECRLGLGICCTNPQCPNCFPRLGASSSNRSSRRTGPWCDVGASSSESSALSSVQPVEQMVVTRSSSVDLLELVVVLCTSDGTRRHVLKAIRCGRNDTLCQLRSVMEAEIPSLPPHFSFLRIIAGHIVHVTHDQESGSKAYKAKHFAPPVADTPQLLIYEDRQQQRRKNKPLEQIAPPTQPSPSRPEQTAVRRQRSEGVLDFCVRHMIEGTHHNQEDSTVVGMVRLHCDATLSDIRQDLAIQLPQQTPSEYRFVRMLEGEVTLLTSAQESEFCHKPLRAYHFAPPYTPKAEIVLLTRKSYEEGEIIQDETKTRELKSLASALRNPKARRSPRDMVKDKVGQYMNAFLNSAGGVLIFGANDDGVIERVPISGFADEKCRSLDERVRLARTVKDDIRKLVDAVALQMEPKVADDLVSILFVPVRRRRDSDKTTTTVEDGDVLSAEEEIYNVIEVHVKPGRRSLYFLDKHSTEAFERRDGSTHLMDEGAIAEALGKTSNDGKTSDLLWRGGWRQLRSSFDFDAQMRRLSDPWAGREWLFAATRQSLFRIANERNGKWGVGISGSRGMGKTSFMSELALRPKHVTKLDVVAHHLCRPDDPDTLNPALFVHSIAAMLARGCKEYRSLMADSSTHSGGDSIGTVMLNALQPEHCESDPDDAFLRGILHPLQEIEARRREEKIQGQEKRMAFPSVILVDAVDESLSADSESSRRRRGSPTIAHLLEKGLTAAGGFPPWIKLIVSFRGDMTDVSGPIQNMSRRLDVIDLDPGNPSELELAREDIRLFLEAYIERTKMVSPFGSHVGKGIWNPTMQAEYARRLKGESKSSWQFQTKTGEWEDFDDSAIVDLNYAHGILDQCLLVSGKNGFLIDLISNTRKDIRSGEELNIRLAVNDRHGTVSSEAPQGNVERVEDKPARNGSETGPSTGPPCHYCNKPGHKRSECPKKKQEEADRTALVERENILLDALAANSQGNYLYARSVLEDIRSSRLEWEQIPSLPCGLDHLYTRFFQHHFGQEDTKDIGNTNAEGGMPGIRAVKPVLEVLLASTKRGVTERDISHAVVAGGAGDPTAVHFCLRDIGWALDVDNSGNFPRYSLRHESIRSWLRENANAGSFDFRVTRGHALLAASLLQRCWPQQSTLSNWLQSGTYSSGSGPAQAEVPDSAWYRWTGWAPNVEDEDVFNLVHHMASSDVGSEDERVTLVKTIGKQNLDSVYLGKTTALHSASSAGDVNSVKLILKADASPDIAVRGRRPLHLAASKGHAKIVELLCSAGADVSSTTSSGRSALLNAVDRGSITTVKCLLNWIERREAKDKNCGSKDLVDASQTDTGRTPLSIAAEEGRIEIVSLLIEAQASVHLADRWGRTPMYYAARSGRAEVVRELASAPRGQETLNWGESGHQRSPLHEATWHGHVDTVRALLECGADPNLVEKDGGSPLHEACYYGSFGHKTEKRRRKHITSGAAETQESESDLRPEIDSEEEAARLKILELLLDRGRCTVNLGETHGCVPLWYAAGGGWTRAVELLLQAGAVVDPGTLPCLSGKDRGGHASPLLRALHRGHYETARVLLAHGAKVPDHFDMEYDSSKVPDDVVDALRNSICAELKDPPAELQRDVISYEMAKRCQPVPRDAFALSKQKDDVNKSREAVADPVS